MNQRAPFWQWICNYGIVMLMLGLCLSLCQSGSSWASDVEVGSAVSQRAPDFELPLLNGNEAKVELIGLLAQYDVLILYFFFAAT
jgi:hypothetical protein